MKISLSSVRVRALVGRVLALLSLVSLKLKGKLP